MQQQQQVQFLEKQRNYYHQKNPIPKKYKKVVYEEESESEPELEQEEDEEIKNEEVQKEPEIKNGRANKRETSGNNIFDYINKNAKRISINISNRNTLGDTLNPIDDARWLTAIDRTTWNYNDTKEKVQKIRDLINMGKHDADLAKYIPGLTDLAIQGMLDDIDT